MYSIQAVNDSQFSLGSSKVHNEFLAIIDTSSDYDTFVRRLNNWANNKLEGGVSSLPQGLRLKWEDTPIMEKQGWVSIWSGNINDEDSIGEYVDLTYDEDGESVPSQFFIDFNIDMDDANEDTIEKVFYKNGSSDISALLDGCSYEEIVISKIQKSINLKKSYNAVILIYNFEYKNEISSTGAFDFIATTNYE